VSDIEEMRARLTELNERIQQIQVRLWPGRQRKPGSGLGKRGLAAGSVVGPGACAKGDPTTLCPEGWDRNLARHRERGEGDPGTGRAGRRGRRSGRAAGRSRERDGTPGKGGRRQGVRA